MRLVLVALPGRGSSPGPGGGEERQYALVRGAASKSCSDPEAGTWSPDSTETSSAGRSSAKRIDATGPRDRTLEI
jgi:hypothetical protein